MARAMTAARRTDASLWKDFERLVARIEQVLAGDAVTIASPDRIRSLITGRLREVDASLRSRVGSAELLVTVECRRRGAKQDVTWIEQLGSKKQAIGAARTIAVSSSAFSSDAVQVAKQYGIDLRILSEIGDADMQDWVLPRFVVHVYKECDLVKPSEVCFFAENGDELVAWKNPGTDAPTIHSPAFIGPDGNTLTLNDLWLRADEQLKIFDAVPKDDQAHLRRLAIEPSDNLQTHTVAGLRRVARINMELSLRWRHERVPLSAAKVVAYGPADPADSLHPQIRAEFESKGATPRNVRFGLQYQKGSDQVVLSVQLTPGKK
jgi:hypothetical protein